MKNLWVGSLQVQRQQYLLLFFVISQFTFLEKSFLSREHYTFYNIDVFIYYLLALYFVQNIKTQWLFVR